MLTTGGSFLIVSLLQDFVVEAILNYFSNVTEHSCVVKVFPIVAGMLAGDVGEARLPSTLSSAIRYQPFLLQVVKAPKSEKPCIF